MYLNTRYHQNIYPTGRTFFVGDIHGCLDDLNAAMELVNFSPEKGDILVSVGDLIDRGPKCVETLELLSEDWFKAVMGNHEKMMFDTVVGQNAGQFMKWMANGGKWYVRLDKRQRVIVNNLAKTYVKDMPYAITVNLPCGKKIGVVHGEVQDIHWAEFIQGLENKQYRFRTLWARKRANDTISAMKMRERESLEPIDGINSVIFGHTPMKQGPVVSRNIIWIDTGAVYGNKITLIEASQVLRVTNNNPLAYQIKYK